MLSPAGPAPPLLKQLLSLTCRPLQVLLLALVSELLAGSPPWLPSSAPPHTVDASEIYHGTAFLVGAEYNPSWSPSSFFLLPPLPGRPAQVQRTKTRDAMGFCALILQLYYIVLWFQQFFDVVSTVST